MFERCLERWRLRIDGTPLRTDAAELLPVLTTTGAPAMLKHTTAPEELAGFGLLEWWDGDGAARVLAREGNVLLMERATGHADLLRWAMQDPQADAAASAVLCDVLARLHAARATPAPPLQPLAGWFEALGAEAAVRGGMFARCAIIANALLADPDSDDVVPLHGDCHHRNVLDFGARGWLAIDPKDRVGDRGFDYAQLLCNPDLPHAAGSARFAAQLAQVSARAGLQPVRLARWTAARAALSAVWFLEDGCEREADHDLAIAGTALDWLAQAPG
ncbi:aminoglycoside phosphotransferase family protein [Thermomonas brevis]